MSKKGPAAMWVNSKVGGAALFALGLIAAACGRATTTESGETHFLISCDSGCGDGLQCLCGVCSKACDTSSNCSDLGQSVTCVEHRGDACARVTKSCDVECGNDADCRGVSSEHTCQAGLCRVPSAPLGIGGSSAGSSGGAGAGSSGSGGAGASAGGGLESACSGCSIEDCAAPGACSNEAACDLVGCSSVLIDENACFRPACSTDADCATAARCTGSYWGQRVDCAEAAGVCECTTGQGLRVRNVCSPTALAGPRGTWQTITVEEAATDVGDLYVKTWVIAADGRVDVVQSGPVAEYEPYVARLSAEDLDELAFMINGAQLRPLLADDTCHGVLDYGVTIKLGLDTGSIEKDVTDCTFADEETGRAPFPDLLALAKRY
jgi:hypothetical protein